jgi:hypothetical protein
VVAGTYRCKTDDRDEVLYMGAIYNDLETNQPIGRLSDGALKAKVVPAGFLKVSASAIDQFMRAYPELCYGPQYALSIDLFHHGAHGGYGGARTTLSRATISNVAGKYGWCQM